MIFEFLILYRRSNDTDIFGVLRDCLAKVLQDNLNEYDTETVERMVLVRSERIGGEVDDENGGRYRRVFLGFSVDLPDETDSARVVVDEFTEALHDTSPLAHLIKFENPFLRLELSRSSD